MTDFYLVLKMDSNETEEFVFTDWAMPKDLKTEFMGEILKITIVLQYFYEFTERNINVYPKTY